MISRFFYGFFFKIFLTKFFFQQRFLRLKDRHLVGPIVQQQPDQQ
jgi:hypothetical protein